MYTIEYTDRRGARHTSGTYPTEESAQLMADYARLQVGREIGIRVVYVDRRAA